MQFVLALYILLEIKTRAENSTSSLNNLKGEHLLQTHLQMAGTGFSYVIVESFHPETETANFLPVKKDELLLSELTDGITWNTVLFNCLVKL